MAQIVLRLALCCKPVVKWLSSKWYPLAVVVTLLLHLAAVSTSAYLNSPTSEEPAHLTAGISYWHFQRFDMYRVNPPLVGMVAALPVLAAGFESDWSKYHQVADPGSRPEFRIADYFVAANGERSLWLVTLARWACIPFSVLGAVVCCRWAHALYGQNAGVVALVLWCSCPSILANAALITTDLAASALGVTALSMFWRWLKQPRLLNSLVAGAALGLAELTKMTWIGLFFLLPLIWFMHCQSWRMRFSQLSQMALILILAVYVLDLGYCFEDSFLPLKDFRFVSASFGAAPNDKGEPDHLSHTRFTDSWLGRIPIPLPKNYILGIDAQLRDVERPVQPSYLRGELRDGGWWYYYIYALAIKIPLGTLMLLLVAIVCRISLRRCYPTWRDELTLFMPAVLVLVLVSAYTAVNLHVRYVLPVLPFVFVWTSQCAQLIQRKRLALAVIVVGLASWSVGSSACIYPHFLSYFNELAGGPIGGQDHLINSNIDWGQDLLSVREWFKEHPKCRPFYFAYEGFIDPRICGIDFGLPPMRPGVSRAEVDPRWLQPGWYAVSVTCLHGYPSEVFEESDKRLEIPGLHPSRTEIQRNAFLYFLWFRAEARCGYSIYIYHITSEDIKSVRIDDR